MSFTYMRIRNILISVASEELGNGLLLFFVTVDKIAGETLHFILKGKF